MKFIVSCVVFLVSVVAQADLVCSTAGSIASEKGVLSVYINEAKRTATFAISRADLLELTDMNPWYYLGAHDKLTITKTQITGAHMRLDISSKASTSSACATKRGCKEARLTAQTAIHVMEIDNLKVHCSAPSKRKPVGDDLD
jgi:acid phosphatase class B